MIKGRIAAFILLLMLLCPPTISTAEDGPVPTDGITIDELWIDAIQSDDKKVWEVFEYIFYNNTGSDVYNGSLYVWIPDGSLVVSERCNNFPDVGCRLFDSGAILCFSVQQYDDNIVYGRPFPDYSFMSYFGQTAELSIAAGAQNSSFNDTLVMNVTLGKPQVVGDFPSVSGEGVHITTNTEQLGAVAEVAFGGGMAEKLGMIVYLNVTNFTPSNDTIDLDLLGLPEGWSGVFIHGGGLVKNVTVPVNESEEIVLHLQAPSYKTEVQLNYFIPIEDADDAEAEYVFEKEMLYDNGFIEVFMFVLEDVEVVEDENLFQLLEPQWSENDQRMKHTLGVLNLSTGSRMSFTVSWKNPSETPDYSLVLLGVFVIALAGIIAFVVLRKRRIIGEKQKADEEEEQEPAEVAEDVPADLEEKKRKILLAMRRLREDHQAGNIPDDVYNDLHDQYKKRAIDIMKEMDKVK